MHKYVPIIWIVLCDEHEDISNMYFQPCKPFPFEEAQFIAVTAYQVSFLKLYVLNRMVNHYVNALQNVSQLIEIE